MQFRSNGICWATRPTNVCLVYLPPSYDVSTGKHYPTIYILHGFSLGRDVLDDWASVAKEWDKLIAACQIQEMIAVIPNGQDAYRGSFYTNSEVAGNYEDYIAKDGKQLTSQ